MIPLTNIRPDRIRAVGEYLDVELTGNVAFDLGLVLGAIDNLADNGSDVSSMLGALDVSEAEVAEIRRMYETTN